MQSSDPSPLTNLFTEQSAKTLPDIEPLVAVTKKAGKQDRHLNTAGSERVGLPTISPELVRSKKAVGYASITKSKPVKF